jgi:glycosyltransferase 2 family protein
MTAARTPGWRRWLLRAGVSLAILAVLFWLLPRGAILDGIARVPPALFAAVFLAFLLGHVAAAAKWWLLIGHDVPFRLALRAHLAGLAANLGLPGVAGGDAVRAAIAWTAAGDRARLAAGSVADRLIDLLALACLAAGGVLAAGGASAPALVSLGIVAAALVLAAWVAPGALPRLWRLFPRLPGRDFVQRACDAAAALGRRPGLLLAVLAASTAIQAAFILLALQLARATGVEVAPAAWIFAWALAKLVAVLPVSLGGLGVREAAMAGLLAPFGAGAAEVVAAGLVWQAVLFLAGGVGAVAMALSGAFVRAAPRHAARPAPAADGRP